MPRRHSARRGLALGLWVLAAFAFVVVLGAVLFTPSRRERSAWSTEVVRRGPLEVKITERGNLESASNLTLRCFVENPNGTAILKIVDEGTVVEKDQVVVELDSSRLRDESIVQKIRVDTADAALTIAVANSEIQKKQNESDIAAADLKLQLVRLDLRKYRDGEHPQAMTLVNADIDLTREYLARAAFRMSFTERLLRKGFSTTKILGADRASVRRAEIDCAVAGEKRRVLNEYTYRRDLAEREANAGLLEQELERVKLRAEAALVQRERNQLAAKRTAVIEHQRYDKLLQQIDACTIRTPRAGMVVYANTDGRRSANGPPIYEGAVVRERQPIIEIPDIADMRVNTRIHESKIAMIGEGLPATIHVDARSGESFHGVVSQVALVPMSGTWPNPDRKEYAALIRITDELHSADALRPGMTAEVEIMADRRESVLQAPVQSCVERGGRYFAWVLEEDAEPQRHEISVGLSNDAAIEIVEGLDEGNAVVLNPRSALPEEIALLEREIPAEREPVPALAPQHTHPTRPEPARPSPGESKEAPGSRPSPGATAAAPVTVAADAKAAPAPVQVAGTDSLAVFNRLDKNCDAKVTEAELPDPMKPVLSQMDTNGDKAIDRDEWNKGAKTWSQHAEAHPPAAGGQ